MWNPRSRPNDAPNRLLTLVTQPLEPHWPEESIVSNRFRILQACKKPGPYVYGVYQDRITRLWPDDK